MATEKLSMYDIRGNLIKEDGRYVVRDNEVLEQLTLSSTELTPLSSTTGHDHDGTEEYYFFIAGTGMMEVGIEEIPVKEGDIIPVNDGAFHRVHNYSSEESLLFICVLGGKRELSRRRNAQKA